LQITFFFYRNGFFTSNSYPRAYIQCGTVRAGNSAGVDKAVTVRVVLSRPMMLDAGQYVNLWIPTVRAFSWAQIHPFIVTSWSQEKQTTLDLYIKSQDGLSNTLYQIASKAPEGSVSATAFIAGLHGISHSVDQYDSVLLLAGGSGIAAVLPYLRKLINGYNTSTCRTRRIHFVWQLKTQGKSIDALHRMC
jgi:NAD(P)H-flavin reductase